MKTMTVDEAQKDLSAVVDEVCESNAPVVLRTRDGREVKLMPMSRWPKASKTWRGLPLHTEEDRLKMKSPYPNEPEWPEASKTWNGRPLYTPEDLAKMKCPYPDEPKWE